MTPKHGESEGSVADGSSLPPLKTNKSKYLVLLLLVLATCGGAWALLRSGDEPQAETTPPPAEPEPPAREQFIPEIELPEEEGPPAKPPQARRERPQEPICDGRLERIEIQGVINGAPRKQVQTCYEQRLKEDNLLQGQMRLLLRIGANGRVESVTVGGSLKDPQVYACVKRAARTWKFPSPKGGCVLTEVPFTLTPKL